MKNSLLSNSRINVLAIVFLLCATSLRAQNPQPTPNPADQFDKNTTMITMRDGVQLYTEYFVPKNITAPLPIIFMRTPYGISGWFERSAGGFLKELVDEGYILAVQDLGGPFKSKGKFGIQARPRHSSHAKSIDEGTGTYDTIRGLGRNVPH